MDTDELYAVAGAVWRSFERRAGWRRHIERDDAVQLAVIHLMTVRNRYDPSRSCRTTFFSFCARRIISNEVAKRRAKSYARTLAPVESDGGAQLDPINLLPDKQPGPAHAAELADELRALDAAVERLPPVLAGIVRRYAAGVSLSAQAAERGVSPQCVSEQYRTALSRLSDMLQSN